MSSQEIDAYLATQPEPKRATLGKLRQTILSVLPQAEQVISYGMPAFKVNGKVVAGFAAFKDHLTYVPHSGSVLGELPKDIAGYEHTPGALHFPVDRPLPKALVAKLIKVRLAELERRYGSPAQAAARTNGSTKGTRGKSR